MRSSLLSGVICAVAFACGTGSDPAAPGGSSSGSSGDLDGGPIGLDGSPAPLGSYSVSFGPESVAPGEEHTKCVVKRLGNPTSMHVGTVHNVLGQEGSHHLIVYRVNDTTEQPTPFDCKPFTDTLDPTKGSTLMISQKKDDALILPDGVAYTLAANQMVRLEMHYINPSAAPIMAQATSTFIPIEDARFKDEADFLFIGTPDIDIALQLQLLVHEQVGEPGGLRRVGERRDVLLLGVLLPEQGRREGVRAHRQDRRQRGRRLLPRRQPDLQRAPVADEVATSRERPPVRRAPAMP